MLHDLFICIITSVNYILIEMSTQTEYYRRLFIQHDNAVKKIETEPIQIIGKKRKYKEAFGYDNDYEVVQNPTLHTGNRGTNWADSYLENNK